MKKISKVLVVYYTKYYEAFVKVEKALKKLKFTYWKANREDEAAIKKRITDADALIVVGGDGTLLRAAHFIQEKPVLHISSSRKVHEAFFARTTGTEAFQRLRQLKQGKYKTIKLMRLEAWLNGKKLPYKALNEVFAGGSRAYHTVRYDLSANGRREEQKSSGVIISTPAGSNAWGKSAGGKALPLTAKKVSYVVREPYFGRLTRPKLLVGSVNVDGKITVKSKIWQGGIVVIDSYKKEFAFNKGSVLIVRASRQPLNLVYF